jgi:hypothetical protein
LFQLKQRGFLLDLYSPCRKYALILHLRAMEHAMFVKFAARMGR